MTLLSLGWAAEYADMKSVSAVCGRRPTLRRPPWRTPLTPSGDGGLGSPEIMADSAVEILSATRGCQRTGYIDVMCWPRPASTICPVTAAEPIRSSTSSSTADHILAYSAGRRPRDSSRYSCEAFWARPTETMVAPAAGVAAVSLVCEPVPGSDPVARRGPALRRSRRAAPLGPATVWPVQPVTATGSSRRRARQRGAESGGCARRSRSGRFLHAQGSTTMPSKS